MRQNFPNPSRLYWLVGALFLIAAASILGQCALG